MREFEEHLARQEQDLNQKTAELQKQRDELERQQEQLNAQKLELQQVRKSNFVNRIKHFAVSFILYCGSYSNASQRSQTEI